MLLRANILVRVLYLLPENSSSVSVDIEDLAKLEFMSLDKLEFMPLDYVDEAILQRFSTASLAVTHNFTLIAVRPV